MKFSSRVQSVRPPVPRYRQAAQEPLPSPRQRTAEDVMGMITACMEELSAVGYHETAAILSIAQLDLRVRVYGITEDELQCITPGARDV